MTRVSLKEAYDNKDVIAQIYAIRDTAESAVDTSEQAVTTANTASDHVDALVPQVEGAVQNANSASASAQASAQTVAGYENRLATVETDLGQTESDLNAVTLRVTTAEGQIVTIQGRVTALETADANNVKITGTHKIGDYAVLLTGNQDFSGTKIAVDSYVGVKATSPNFDEGSTSASGYEKVLTQALDSQNNLVFDMRSVRSNLNMRTHRQILFNKTSDNKDVVAYLDLRIADDGTVSLLLIKTVNGTETGRQTLANLTT